MRNRKRKHVPKPEWERYTALRLLGASEPAAHVAAKTWELYRKLKHALLFRERDSLSLRDADR
jgi:hypothetical protein